MAAALGHADHGYYITHDPLGADGDFTTAPEISQVFGELIGLWAAVVWQQMGCPDRTLLVECGPGRGTLMSDALRAAKSLPGFVETIELHLVETSPALRRRQSEALTGHLPQWHDTIDSVPSGPTILIANEFFDALPIRQLIRTQTHWAERCVDIGEDGFVFVTGGRIDPAVQNLPQNTPSPIQHAEPGDIFETSPVSQEIAGAVAARLAASGGAALIVDYGHPVSGLGDTLQALRRHAYADPLTEPGTIDITAHVDFAALAETARQNGAQAFGPVPQYQFLRALGISQRTGQLTRNADPDTAARLALGSKRLIDPDDMGTLFKVMALTGGDAPPPAGFET